METMRGVRLRCKNHANVRNGCTHFTGRGLLFFIDGTGLLLVSINEVRQLAKQLPVSQRFDDVSLVEVGSHQLCG